MAEKVKSHIKKYNPSILVSVQCTRILLRAIPMIVFLTVTIEIRLKILTSAL